MVIAAILAGGSGSRMGAGVPKQFLPLAGSPVLLHTLGAFVSSGLTDAAVISVPETHVESTRRLVGAQPIPVWVVPGGLTRGGTLLNVLEFLEAEGLLAGSVVLTHDAVRPFVSRRIIEENIARARETGACNTCIPATDTVFLSADGKTVSSVPDRRTVFHAQTPQSFLGEELLALCRAAPPDAFAAFTDGCSVYTYFGRPVAMAAGDRDNLKITYPEDMETAARILRKRGNRAEENAEA